MKKEPLKLSKMYRIGSMQYPEYGGLAVARALFEAFVKAFKEGNAQKVYDLLNVGFRQTAYIRLRKQSGQQTSDAEQIFYAWLQEVDLKTRNAIVKQHKIEKEDFIASQMAQLFPAREVKFGICDPELEPVEDDTDRDWVHDTSPAR